MWSMWPSNRLFKFVVGTFIILAGCGGPAVFEYPTQGDESATPEDDCISDYLVSLSMLENDLEVYCESGSWYFALDRDPAFFPFSSASPWNMPIGDQAIYEEIDASSSQGENITESQEFPRGGLDYTYSTWGIPVFLAEETDKYFQFDLSNGTTLSIQLPEDASPSPDTDAPMVIINPDHTKVYEFFNTTQIDDQWKAFAGIENDLEGLGTYDTYHGIRAAGVSSLGGMIRQGELKNGIFHVLAAAVDGDILNPDVSGAFYPAVTGAASVYPASSADNWTGEGYYFGTGNLYMGSLLAIPIDVNLDELNIQSDSAYRVAEALKYYGAYIVDIGESGQQLKLYLDQDSEEDIPLKADEPTFEDDLDKIVLFLEVVANNGPESIGGGGIPLLPKAKPLP